MSLGDINLDGHMSFEEFVKYVTNHEKKLWIVFKKIDTNHSGKRTQLCVFFVFMRGCAETSEQITLSVSQFL